MWNKGSDYKRVPQASLGSAGSTNAAGHPMENLNSAARKPSSGLPSTLKVVSSPRTDMALTNKAYCSINDASHFLPEPGFPAGMISIMNQIVLTVSADAALPDGCLALNAIQRKVVRVSVGDDVQVNRFVPEKGCELLILTLDLQFVKFREKQEIDAEKLKEKLKNQFCGQIMTEEQKVSFEYRGTNFIFSVKEAAPSEQAKQSILQGKQATGAKLGLWTRDTQLILETTGSSGILIANQKGTGGRNLFKSKDFNFQKLGIGGLDTEFEDIFRRAFSSRLFPPVVINKLGIKHVKGMLLWGPPGTGKTLIARQIGKMLNGKEPKIVNGPEVLSKFVGETEKNVRELFAGAEAEQKEKGDESELHIIIFDEIDAICKARGSTRDGTGVHDSIVNQLLTKIDGVESLNNILLIGMTNRKDLLDEALLRPGRLEVQIEIGLPDMKGRAQILTIHSSKMKENSFLAADVDLGNLAERTKNFSGAELEGLVRSATSFALSRQVDYDDLNKAMDENIKVLMSDFERALDEIFAIVLQDMKDCDLSFQAGAGLSPETRVNFMSDCGQTNTHIQENAKILVDRLKTSEHSSLLSCVLEGPRGSGKTALAATIALESEAPFIKIISAENMIALSESTKCAMMNKVFEDAYRSPLSVIIIDDIERVLEFVNIGPRFSNLILQTLLVLITKLPPKGKKLFIIGTTSMKDILIDTDIFSAFSYTIPVPKLNSDDIRKVLRNLEVFSPQDVDKAVNVVEGEMPIKKLLMLIEISKKQGSDQDSQEKIDLGRFEQCYEDLAR